jgi:hypothetical protein
MSVRLPFVVDGSQLLNHRLCTPQSRMNGYKTGDMLNASASATMLLATKPISLSVKLQHRERVARSLIAIILRTHDPPP